MAKVINRDVPIAEENTTLTGQPATNMYDDWSEEMEDRADNVYDDKLKVRFYSLHDCYFGSNFL